MKRLITLMMCAVAFYAHAQSPQGISYQAVATDLQGAPLENHAIVVKFSILQGAPTGSAVYIETHNTSTDQYGMFNLILGLGIHQGTASSLGEVNWGVASHFLKVDLDTEGDGSFISMGTQQMMSVPYALYAEEAGNAGDDDPTNEIQSLSLSGDTLSLSDGGVVVLPTTSGDNNQYNGGISIECVDMGVSALCAGLGLDPSASLGPSGNYGYQYSLCVNEYNTSTNYISCPHWRKFQINGLPQGISGLVVFYTYYYNGNTYNSDQELFPEIGDDGEYYVYVYMLSGSCITQDALSLSIPVSQSEGAFQHVNSYRDYRLFYSDGNSLIDTNTLIDFN
tara:strand:- start:606 stop:1616 length:1011 start_codon:yes stop_codon:yes gene_type:complete